MKKPWWKSKTILFNASVASLVALEAGWGMLQPVLPVNFYLAVAVALPAANAALRVITSQGVSLK